MLRFNCNDAVLLFNCKNNSLTCITYPEKKKLWIKKFNETVTIQNILYDDYRYYVACRIGDMEGLFISLLKSNGSTQWFIPGRTFLEVLYGGYLYLLFVDKNEDYFLLKVECDDGTKLWHHKVDNDLYYYHFKKEGIYLYYASGKKEILTYCGKCTVFS